MIERTTAFIVDGKAYTTLADAQSEALASIISLDKGNLPKTLVEHAEEVIDILTTGPRSKPKARAINGGTRKPRRTKAEMAAARAAEQATNNT